MLQIFRTNAPVAAIFLLIYTFIVRLHHFILPTDWQPSTSNFFSDIIYNWIGTTGLLPSIIALLLVFIQAFILNQIVANYKIRRTTTYFPAIAYVLVTSAVPEFLELHPLHFANTFTILVINQLFQSYRKYEAASELFNIGFFVAVGSLFYFSINILILFSILGLIVIRSFNLRELLIIIIGFAVPFVLVGTYLLWTNQFENFQNLWVNFYFFDLQIEWNTVTYIEIGIITLIGLLSLINFQAFYSKTNIQVQKYINMVYWMMFISIISFVYQEGITVGHFLIFATPLAIFLAFSLLKIKNVVVAELLHFTLLLIVLVLQYRTVLLDSMIAN